MGAPTPSHLSPSQLSHADTAFVKVAIQNAMAELRVACPAIVVDFDEDTQCVTAQIAMKELVRFPDAPKWTAIHPIYNVPIVIPRAGGFSLTVPISPGDEGLLVFTDQAFDLWWLSGGVQPPGDNPPIKQPQHERRRHDITDCVFIPGCWNQKNVLPNYATDRMQLRNDEGTVQIEIDGSGNVNITTMTGVVAISSLPKHTTIDGKDFLMHTHDGVQTGGGTSGPVTP